MKNLMFAAVVALAWTATSRAQDTHEALAEDAIKAFNSFADVLGTIKDKASADKAKTDLQKTGEKLAGLKERFDKIGEPKGDKKDELDKKFKPKMEEVQKRVQNEMLRIATKVEGGQDIIKDIGMMLAPKK
jgi:Skp family chaperone for outer membrane proteins